MKKSTKLKFKYLIAAIPMAFVLFSCGSSDNSAATDAAATSTTTGTTYYGDLGGAIGVNTGTIIGTSTGTGVSVVASCSHTGATTSVKEYSISGHGQTVENVTPNNSGISCSGSYPSVTCNISLPITADQDLRVLMIPGNALPDEGNSTSTHSYDYLSVQMALTSGGTVVSNYVYSGANQAPNLQATNSTAWTSGQAQYASALYTFSPALQGNSGPFGLSITDIESDARCIEYCLPNNLNGYSTSQCTPNMCNPTQTVWNSPPEGWQFTIYVETDTTQCLQYPPGSGTTI